MSLLTIATVTGGFSAEDLDRAAGRADAYDDHGRRSIEELSVLAGYIADFHPNAAYAEGYAAYTKGAELEEQRTSGRTETT